MPKFKQGTVTAKQYNQQFKETPGSALMAGPIRKVTFSREPGIARAEIRQDDKELVLIRQSYDGLRHAIRATVSPKAIKGCPKLLKFMEGA